MSSFWVFECTFVANNNMLMGEVFIGATRAEMVEAMKRFFGGSRATVMLAEVLGAYFIAEGKVQGYFNAMPFVKVEIAKETLGFGGEALASVVGDLEGGGIARKYLAKGRSIAVDATEEDEEDDEDPVLKPFSFVFDAAGFLASLFEREGALASGAEVELVRPIGLAGFPETCDANLYGEAPVKIGPGWWDAEPGSQPKRFDPKKRFVKDREVPMM